MASTYAAVIVAAGSSRRAGFDKLMAPLGQGTVLSASFQAFYSSPLISEVVLVTTPERFESILPFVTEGGIPVSRADGGGDRHDSVMSGLLALKTSPDFVAVHDGARPLLHPEQLARCLEAAERYGAAASARPVVDTLKRVDSQGFTLAESIDRSTLWAMETPQVFRLGVLLDAYRIVMERGLTVTDEVSAMEAVGKGTFLVQNSWANPKITLPGDLESAELLYGSLHFSSL